MIKREAIITIMILILLLISQPLAVYATEGQVWGNLEVNVKVPEGFSDEIVVQFTEIENNTKLQMVLNKENNYSGVVTVLVGNEYEALCVIKSKDAYISNLADFYKITSNNVKLNISINKTNEKPEAVENVEESIGYETRQYDAEDLSASLNLKRPEEVLKEYEDTIEIMNNNSNFDSFLSIYSGGMFYKYFLKADDTNTEEKWNAMNQVDRFNYYILYYGPYTSMMNSDYSNENSFVDELVATKNLLMAVENGKEVYGAVENVWRWLYKYWESTGTFYKFYSDINVPEIVEEDTYYQVIGDSGKAAIKEIIVEANQKINDDEIEKTVIEKNTNAVIDWVKNMWLTLTIFAIAGSIFVIITIKNKKEEK